MKFSAKSTIIYFLLVLLILGGCSFDEEIVSNDVSKNMYGVYVSEDNEKIAYELHEKNSDKSLGDENLENLSVLIYYRYDNEMENEYYIYDFDRQYCFNVKKISWIIDTQYSIKPADEEMKSSIISKMREIDAEGWWGETYDVEKPEIQGWFGQTEYSHVWRLYLCFSNGDVVTLYGVGYDGAMYAPEELDEFLRYLRSFIGK